MLASLLYSEQHSVQAMYERSMQNSFLRTEVTILSNFVFKSTMIKTDFSLASSSHEDVIPENKMKNHVINSEYTKEENSSA